MIKCSTQSFGIRLSMALLLLALAGPSRLARADDQPDKAAGQTRLATFDDILLDLKKDEPFKSELLTEKVKKIDGKAIKIRGYILPGVQESGIKQFVLMRDNKECCFGPGAALHDCILVEMQGDATTKFTVVPVSVEGKFSINGKFLAPTASIWRSTISTPRR